MITLSISIFSIGHIRHLLNRVFCSYLKYEDSGSLGFLLTPSQRSWVNTIKKTYNRRPKKQPKRPTVSWRPLIMYPILSRSIYFSSIYLFILFHPPHPPIPSIHLLHPSINPVHPIQSIHPSTSFINYTHESKLGPIVQIEVGILMQSSRRISCNQINQFPLRFSTAYLLSDPAKYQHTPRSLTWVPVIQLVRASASYLKVVGLNPNLNFSEKRILW